MSPTTHVSRPPPLLPTHLPFSSGPFLSSSSFLSHPGLDPSTRDRREAVSHVGLHVPLLLPFDPAPTSSPRTPGPTPIPQSVVHSYPRPPAR